MKDFKTLLNEVPSKKIVIGFGRFNPPTTGHELLINKVTQYARSKGSPAKIYVTATEDKKKNPLKQERKIYYMKRMFGQNTPLVPTKSPNQRTIIEVAKHLNTKEKITELTLIAGSDRIAEYKRLLNQYNGKDYNFDKITVLSSGRRDPDSDLAEGMSATKMRTAASSGKFTDFKRGVPRRMSIADSKRLFNEVRKGMGLPPIREEIVLPTSELREDYVAKKIFNIGAVVEDDKGVYEVMDRGANYISVSDEDGNVSKKWLHEVRQIAERNTVNDYHSNNELVYKGFTTENLHNYYEIKDKFLDLFETNKDPVAILSCLKLVDQSLKILEEGKSRGYALIEEAGADSIIKMKLADSLNSIGELENHDYLDQINADLADLLAREPNMKQEIKEQKNLKIDPQNKFRFTSADRIKVARIIAGSLGVDNPEKMSNPTQLINFGLRKLRTKRVTPEFAEIVKKMLQTANTAGIDYDRQYLPAIMRSGKFAVESKSFKDFMNEISGSGVDPIVVQLRKNINLKGNYTFEFTDGSKGKMSPGASEGILRKYESLRRPAQKLNVSKGMGKSMKSLKDTLSNWDSVANKEDPKDKKSGREEPTRGLVNPMDKKPVKKEELEEKKDPEKDYKPHMMYDPKTGKGIMAKKFADHEKLKKQGYTHDDPSTKQIEENKGVAEKAKKSGIPKGILMQVFRRGMAAYGTGHRPGASQQQWAFARVNSFIGKGKGTWGGADKDLAAKARKAMKKESLDEDVKATKERIKKEKEMDKLKHDKMMDRARTQDAQKKNRETKPMSKEESEGKQGIMGVGSDVTRKVRQGLRAELMMRMAMTKKKMAKAKKGSKEFDELYAEYKKCKDKMRNLPGKEGANEEKKPKSSKYYDGVAKKDIKARRDEFERDSKKDDSDPTKYDPAAGDLDKDGDFKKTKKSKHTLKYHKKYGDPAKEETIKTIKVGEDAVGTDAELHYAVVSNRRVEIIGEKSDMINYCKENGGRVWKTTKQVGDLVEEKRPSVDEIDTSSNYNLAKSIMSYKDYKKMLKLAGGIQKRKVDGSMEDEPKRVKDEKRFKQVDEEKKNCGCGKDPCETYGDLPEEKEMTDAQMKKREDIVKGMKDKTADFKKRYGKDYKNVMYATATKMAMKEAAGEEMEKIDIEKPVETEDKPKADKIKKKSGTPKSDDPYDLEIFVADPKADAMLDELTPDEIENVVKMFDPEQDPMNSKLDIFDLYDDEELAIETEDEDGEVEMEDFEWMGDDVEQQLNEVLSRTERIKNRVRIRRTKARRARAVKIALRRHSSQKVINSRARRLAVKLLKRRFFKKAPNQLSVGERERAEARIAKMRHVVKRIALKLAPRVRQMEKKRLHSRKSSKRTVGQFRSALAGGRIRTAAKQTGRKTKGNTVGQRSRTKKGYGGATGKRYGGVKRR